MQIRHYIVVLLVSLVGLSACNTTKFVPKDKYLLNKASVKVLDTKDVPSTTLIPFLRQRQNTEILGFWKLQLDIYNTAPLDTTTKSKKRLAKNAHKLGEEPEIYDEGLTRASMVQLNKAMQNMGYFDAKVDTVLTYDGQKINVQYLVTANSPYYLKSVSYYLPHAELMDAALDYKRSLLQEGMLFDANLLDEERTRMASHMRRRGYYYFQKDLLCYKADSSGGFHQIDLEMSMQNYFDELPDSLQKLVFQKYKIHQVFFHMDYDPSFAPDTATLHQHEEEGYIYTWVGEPLLRANVLRNTSEIRPGELFNERRLEKTYERINQLGVVRYVDITFEAVSDSTLDCHIVLSRSKLNSFSAEVGGTYSNGDWGLTAGVNYLNRNLFKGAEELQVGVSGSYEWRQNGGRAIEAKVGANLAFSNQLRVGVGYNYQTRPDEFTRTIANASLGYKLPSPGRGWTHSVSLVDISYVYLPWISDEFRARFITASNPLKYSYQDHFIEAISYTCQYSGYRQRHPNQSYAQTRFFAETAGNAMWAVAKAVRMPTIEGFYAISGVPFSQYAKLDWNFTYHHFLIDHHRLAYHVGCGVALPYGNSLSIPYEKRFFAGGSNHVRGWLAHELGPGAYRGEGTFIDYESHSGDLHLDLSLEYRWRFWSVMELAAFTDAGNIWTIRNYTVQPYGQFRWKDFYRQLAWAYGVGLRLDFSFLIFRMDLGVKLYDPTRLYYDQKMWRTASNGLKWEDDVTLHFAIGYPF